MRRAMARGTIRTREQFYCRRFVGEKSDLDAAQSSRDLVAAPQGDVRPAAPGPSREMRNGQVRGGSTRGRKNCVKSVVMQENDETRRCKGQCGSP
jgi:hypothetical protein